MNYIIDSFHQLLLLLLKNSWYIIIVVINLIVSFQVFSKLKKKTYFFELIILILVFYISGNNTFKEYQLMNRASKWKGKTISTKIIEYSIYGRKYYNYGFYNQDSIYIAITDNNGIKKHGIGEEEKYNNKIVIYNIEKPQNYILKKIFLTKKYFLKFFLWKLLIFFIYGLIICNVVNGINIYFKKIKS